MGEPTPAENFIVSDEDSKKIYKFVCGTYKTLEKHVDSSDTDETMLKELNEHFIPYTSGKCGKIPNRNIAVNVVKSATKYLSNHEVKRIFKQQPSIQNKILSLSYDCNFLLAYMKVSEFCNNIIKDKYKDRTQPLNTEFKQMMEQLFLDAILSYENNRETEKVKKIKPTDFRLSNKIKHVGGFDLKFEYKITVLKIGKNDIIEKMSAYRILKPITDADTSEQKKHLMNTLVGTKAKKDVKTITFLGENIIDNPLAILYQTTTLFPIIEEQEYIS